MPEETADSAAPALATAEQLAAEAMLRALLDDSEVTALLAAETARLQSVQLARESGIAAGRLGAAVRAWCAGLAMRWLSGDPSRPAILLTTDNTPRTWYGYTVPPTGAAGDNPDHVYRNAFIDGAGQYRIHGRIDRARRPVQFSIEVMPGEPGRILVSSAATGNTAKPQVDIVTDREIEIAEDGRFTIELAAGQERGPNRLLLSPGPMTLIVRDVLDQWSASPTWLQLERLDQHPGNFSSLSAIKRRVMADLPGYLDFWTGFPLRWMGGLAPNTVKPPVPRDGGWGWQAGIRFALEPGRFVLVTMRRGAAAYLGVQACDPWFLGADGHQHRTSLNNAQATAHDGDCYTFVIGPEDPGVADWVETGGVAEGMVVLRWQGVPAGADFTDKLLAVRFLGRGELERDYPDLPRVSDQERAMQRALHALDYALRYADMGA